LTQKSISNAYALSKYVQKGIEKIAPCLKGKMKLISYPISPKFTTMEEKPFKSLFEKQTIITVAGIEPRKGLDILIKAISLIPNNFILLIKGEIRDIIYMENLLKLVKELNLEHKVRFFSNELRYEALASYYKSSVVFVLPSRDECLGVAILEALHCGVPVLATNVGGIPDMIKNGVNGILVDANDEFQLADAISSILNNNDFREKLVENSLSVLIDQYYKDRITLKNALEQSIENFLGLVKNLF